MLLTLKVVKSDPNGNLVLRFSLLGGHLRPCFVSTLTFFDLSFDPHFRPFSDDYGRDVGFGFPIEKTKRKPRTSYDSFKNLLRNSSLLMLKNCDPFLPWLVDSILDTWGQFHQHFMHSFYAPRSLKRKKTVNSSSFLGFCDLWV